MNSLQAAADRQAKLLAHLAPAQNQEALARMSLEAQPCSAGDSSGYERRASAADDVVVVSALRTAVTKARRGGLKDCTGDELLSTVFKATIQQTGIEPAAIGDVVIGSVLPLSGQRANECRIAMFLAGFPDTVPVHTVNRQCSSGLQAIASVAAAIKSGYYGIGLAGGVETMTADGMSWKGSVNPKIEGCAEASDCLLPMGITSENVAAKYGVTREQQDKLAARSHARAAAATKAGKFRDEIVPMKALWKDPKTGEEKEVYVEHDDGFREGASAATLGKLPAVFKKGGTTTAGNSSQVSDGASACLLMTRAEAQRRGLPILGVFRSFAAVGVPPGIMGVGPAVAIPEAVKRAGLTLDDIDLYELNEAFASQATYCIEKLGLDSEKVNVNGGAIALGHPLGCTGSKLTATLLHEMKRRGRGTARFGVVSMCIGSGMGAAAVFETGGEVDGPRNLGIAQRQEHLSKDAVV